jgi:hypothetical protein
MPSHHARECVTSIVNCRREIAVVNTAPHANSICDVKVSDIMGLYLVLGDGGLIHHAKHDSDKLRAGTLFRSSQLDQLQSAVFLYR